MSSSVNDSNLERKFQSVTNTQDSIQSLSLWIIHHKNHAKKIVQVWLKVLKKAKIPQRLVLFYLANDVIQNSKRKGTTLFLEAFQTALPEAAILLKDDQIRGSVQRVLTIWEQRTVYPSEFIDELNGVLNNTKTLSAAVTKIVAEFKPESIIEKIRLMVKTEAETAKKLLALNNTKFDAANSEILRQFKDRKHGQQFSKDFEDATRCLEEYIIAVERDLALRIELIQLLEQAEIYYDTQRGEAKIVSNAYKSFSQRVSAQKKRLADIKKNLPSPFPSPCADAPSPTNSEGIPDFSSAEVPKNGSPESVPSPEGTPEDLRLSPPIDPSQGGVPTTVSSFMPQAGMMAMFLEVFQTGSPASQEQKSGGGSSSLDSRLMKLVNKFPNKGPVPAFLEQKGIFPLGGDDTPVKDENSGQTTPVQDESGGVRSAANRKKITNDSSQHHKVPGPKNGGQTLVKNQQQQQQPQNGLNKKKGPEEDFVEPLQPPPMPNFGSFGFLDSPPINNPLQLAKSRPDPRLNSQNYKSNRNDDSFQGVDDTEIMDMEIEDSDDDGEGEGGSGELDVKKNHKSLLTSPKTTTPTSNSFDTPSSKLKTNCDKSPQNNSLNFAAVSRNKKSSKDIAGTIVVKGVTKLSPAINSGTSLESGGMISSPGINKLDPMIGGGLNPREFENSPSQEPSEFATKDPRGFSRIETVQTLRNDEWDGEPSWPDMDMPPPPIPQDEQLPPSYDYDRPTPQYVPPTNMPYHRPPPPPIDNNYEYNMYNRQPNYPPPIHFDGGMPRKYGPGPLLPEKRFNQRPPFRRGRGRGYFSNKQY